MATSRRKNGSRRRREGSEEMTPKLIQCGDHSWAPWCIVCVHLASGESHQWEAIPKVDEISEAEFDWLCPACKWRFDELGADDFKAICIHCVRAMQQKG